jgi:hypothetical protein
MTNLTMEWCFEKPTHSLGQQLQLLTIGSIPVYGVWTGECGQFYAAWAPTLPVNKEQFNAVLEHYRTAPTTTTKAH